MASLPRALTLAWASRAESLRDAPQGGFAALCRKGQDERPSAALRGALAAFTPGLACWLVRKALLLSLFETGERTEEPPCKT